MNDAIDSQRGGQESRSSYGTSRSLIDRVRADDTDAWSRLVSLYAPLVAHWCRRWRLAESDAADVFQEVFQSVARHIATFRNDRRHDTFRGWLRTITLHKIHDHFRRQGQEPQGIGGSVALERMSRVPDPAAADESSDGGAVGPTDEEAAIEQRLFQQGLELIRGEFETRTWQAFWQTAVEGRAAKDVAADLAMSPGAVRVAKSRVLQRLRAELGDLPE